MQVSVLDKPEGRGGGGRDGGVALENYISRSDEFSLSLVHYIFWEGGHKAIIATLSK